MSSTFESCVVDVSSVDASGMDEPDAGELPRGDPCCREFSEDGWGSTDDGGLGASDSIGARAGGIGREEVIS